MSNTSSAQPDAASISWYEWLRGGWGLAAIAATIYTVLFTVWTFTHWGGDELRLLIGDAGFLPIALVGAFTAFGIWRQPNITSLTRRAWLLMGLALLLTFLGDLIYTLLEVFLQVSPFPSIADLFYLLFYLILMLSLLSFPYSPIERGEQHRLYLDVAIVTVASWMIIWYFIIALSVNSLGFDLESLLAVAYPLCDLAIIYGLVTFLFRHPDISIRSGFVHLLGGMVLFVLADFNFGIQNINNTYISGDPGDSLFVISYLFFVFAALRQHESLKLFGEHFQVTRASRWLWVLPYVMLAIGYSLVVWVFSTTTEITSGVRGLLVGALILTALVSVRQILDLRENRLLNEELRLRLKELEEAGTALNRAQYLASIGTLAAGVAHEINNPLGVIIAAVAQLRRIYVSDSVTAMYHTSLARIERSAWHGAKIARSLLTYARGGDLSLTRTTPQDLFKDALALFPLPSASKVEVKVNIDSDAPDVICDADQIAQVLANLISNARDAITPPGTITLSANRHTNGSLIIKVNDMGKGMDAETLARAFDPFYTTKPIGEGTGLGLSISRGIVSAHDGTLDIESKAGEGTTVRMNLPLEPRTKR